MAYSTLLSLENTIDQILNHDQFSISPREEREIVSLDKCVVSFQAFLEDFPCKAKNLEARIRDVAAEAEEIIEWFLVEKIDCSCLCTNWIAALRGFTFKRQLQKVRDEMESIAAEVVEIKNSIEVKDIQLGDSSGASSSSVAADAGKTDMVGFNENLIEIKEKLCGWAPQLQVLPIFGMGGIGKTTLARNAYCDPLIMEHFQIRVWVTVSQDYSESRILLNLLDSMKEFDRETTKENSESPKETSEDGNESMCKIHELSNSEMALKVHKVLLTRRFFIVMDDIWSTKVLDDVKHLFPNANNGSRIMLTTRLKEVATYANSSSLFHEMHLMDPDQSWNLLQRKVFIHQDHVSYELESIGMEIASSCGGLPLAIVVVAGLLSTTSKNLNSWKEVARNIKSSLATADGQLIEKILSLSYIHLPQHLRPCFLYMGGLPEDHEIKATNLVRLWIAESFVKPVVSKEFEDTAQDYLEDLVDRSLIVVAKRKSNGKIKCCSLHDMVREMCIKLSREEKFLVHAKGSREWESMKDFRRVSISHSDKKSLDHCNSSTLRTIMYFNGTLSDLWGFRLLRVLNLLRVRSTKFDPPSSQFFELYNLKYLALWYSEPIPTSISNLRCLQTLMIEEIHVIRMPCEIWNLHKLRHLMISNSFVVDLDTASCALKNLQTLGKVELMCSVSTLNLIPNLTNLWLTYSKGSGKLLFHNLVHLRRLEKLHLELGYGWRNSGKPNLVLPRSLKKLTLIGWGKEEPYLDIVGPFPNLEVLKLKSFNFMPQEWRTNDEDFPQLKFLFIEESNLRRWETESEHFPRLKSLMIHYCRGLSEIPDCIGEIPTLELIELKHCTDSLADSAKRIQEEAQSYDDDVFQVRCIDCLPIEELWPKPIVSPTRARKSKGWSARRMRRREIMRGY